MSNSRLRRKNISLHEILEELEQNDEETEVPNAIIILPPDNCNADLTDEDSGDENVVMLHNLPGSQLRAPAEVTFDNLSDDDYDTDFDIPLAQLTKRPRLDAGDSASPSEEANTATSSSFSKKTTIPKTKEYKWHSRDIRPIHNLWNAMQTVQLKQTPLYFFELMFDNYIFGLIVNFTNLYATKKNKEGNITIREMKCFFGILLYSGYVVVPRRYMYWENAADCGMSIVYNAMSRDRFSYIISNLHCADNCNLDKGDKFAKLRPLFHILKCNFAKYAPYDENYSIDEAMKPYYGGHPCKQYIRGKPIRWGYKFWVGATRIGYIVWFLPYQGEGAEELSEYKKLGLGASVVLQFSDILREIDLQAPFHLFFDNFFTSVPLLDELRVRGFKATGTVRENRLSKCPLEKNNELKKSERGTYKYKSTRREEVVYFTSVPYIKHHFPAFPETKDFFYYYSVVS